MDYLIINITSTISNDFGQRFEGWFSLILIQLILFTLKIACLSFLFSLYFHMERIQNVLLWIC